MNYRTIIRLQKCLYLNNYLYITWVLATGFFLFMKIGLLGHLTKYLTPAVFTLLTVIEGVRLYLGQYGNLSSKVPEMAGFLMITILMEIPLLSYFLFNPYLHSTPTEMTLHVALMSFSLLEVLIGYFALKQASDHAKSVYLSHRSNR